MRRHFFHRDQVGFIAELAGSLDHLLEAARGIQHQLVRQYHREWLVADDVAGAPYRMAEAERRLLPREAHRTRLGLVARQDLHFGLLAARAKRGASSYIRSKWSSITPLLRPVTKMKCSMPASLASSTTYWISGLSTMVSISFGIALVAGRNAGAEAGDREKRLCGFSWGVGIPLGEYGGSHVGSRFAAANKGGCVWSAALPHATVNRHADVCSLPPRRQGSGRRRAANAGVSFPPGFPTTKSRFVKLFETVTRPPACRISRAAQVPHGANGRNHWRTNEPARLSWPRHCLLCGEARAQSSSGSGLQNFFDNIFTGSIAKGNQTAPSGQRPGASAQAQAAPDTAAPHRHGAARTAPPAIP